MSKLTKLFIGLFVLLFFALSYVGFNYFKIKSLEYSDILNNDLLPGDINKVTLNEFGEIDSNLEIVGVLECLDGYDSSGCLYSVKDFDGNIYFLGNINQEIASKFDIGTTIRVSGLETVDEGLPFPLLLVNDIVTEVVEEYE